MATPIDPASVGFLLAESRQTPMHVAGMHLYEKPADAGPNYVREVYEHMRDVEDIAPLFLKHPARGLTTAGAWVWKQDDLFDIEHHVRHSALPEPGRVRELLDLCGRLHGQRLAYERPLWEAHVIEGLADGRFAMYFKIHHALVDGVSSMRLLQSVLSSDPEQRGMPAPWANRPNRAKADQAGTEAEHSLAEVPISALRTALGVTAEAAGLPGALVKTLTRATRNETSSLTFNAPRTMINRNITGARRFAAQDWEIERLRAVGKATGTTINDVVLAMCGGALRTYLLEQDELPSAPLISMVPVSLHARSKHQDPDKQGGNAVGSLMVKLGTDLDDPEERLRSIHKSMKDGKDALASMTPVQILAMSAVGMSPSVLTFRLGGLINPPFNTIISNVPGPRVPQYYNGARLAGMYPLSIPFHGVALNITCTSYAGEMAFGLTGCRRTVPHLQRLLTHLDDELAALEKAAGV